MTNPKGPHTRAVNQTPEEAFRSANPDLTARLSVLPTVKIGRSLPFTVSMLPITEEGSDVPNAFEVKVNYLGTDVISEYTLKLKSSGRYEWGVTSVTNDDIESSGQSNGPAPVLSGFNTWLSQMDSAGCARIMHAIMAAEQKVKTPVPAKAARPEK